MSTPLQERTSLVSSQLAMLRQLEWRVRHAVENVLSGEYRSAFRGRGMEFDQVVKYTFGDDVRDIDWNVTARLGEPYRKKFVEERGAARARRTRHAARRGEPRPRRLRPRRARRKSFSRARPRPRTNSPRR